jgi:glycosyltransferase involved in cell wall biosynthesis
MAIFKQNIIVSVCMLTYKHEKYIEKAIRGVLEQKIDFCIELIIANDCSPDNTNNIINEIINSNNNNNIIIKYFLHPINIGMIENSKFVLEQTNGKYIAICEGDDYWIDQNKLIKQVEFLEKNEEFGLVYTDLNIYVQKYNYFIISIFKNNVFKKYNKLNEIILSQCFLAPCTWVYRKSLISDYSYKFNDVSFAVLIDIVSKSKIKYLPITTTVYRKLEISASHFQDVNSIYERINGLLNIQLYFIRKLELDAFLTEKVKINHAKTVLPYLIILKKESELIEIKNILKNCNQDFKSQILLIISNLPKPEIILSFLFKLRSYYIHSRILLQSFLYKKNYV